MFRGSLLKLPSRTLQERKNESQVRKLVDASPSLDGGPRNLTLQLLNKEHEAIN